MPAQSGRNLLIFKNAVAISGLRETSISHDGSPVDVTGKSDSGYRTLASFSGMEALDISGSGVLKDDIFRDIALAGTGTTKLLDDITLEWGDGSAVSGDFYLASYEMGGVHDGEQTYDVTLQSSGAWTYTPAA